MTIILNIIIIIIIMLLWESFQQQNLKPFPHHDDNALQCLRRSYATCLWAKYGNKVRRRQ